jgi:hypothetical protein
MKPGGMQEEFRSQKARKLTGDMGWDKSSE